MFLQGHISRDSHVNKNVLGKTCILLGLTFWDRTEYSSLELDHRWLVISGGDVLAQRAEGRTKMAVQGTERLTILVLGERSFALQSPKLL